MALVALSIPTTSGKPPEVLDRVIREVQQAIIDSLTKMPDKLIAEEEAEKRVLERAKELTFTGATYEDAQASMEKFFLANRMSDGNPLVPPTRARVEAMIAASGLPADHQIGVMDPAMGMTTVESVAINAVMAGCLPAYMPVLVGVAEIFCDPAYDMHGCMVTTGLNAPLIIISGPIIKEINLNYSYSVVGPGWKANTTIGRASRLMIINIGQAWPGINDMKDVGNPGKFGIVMAENEEQTPEGWGTWREREGFAKTDSTVSCYAAHSYRQIRDIQKYFVGERPYEKTVDPLLPEMMKTALNSRAEQWGEDMLIDFSPVMARNLSGMGLTIEAIQQDLWEKARVPRKEFGPRKLGAMIQACGIPEEYANAPDDALIPVVPTPKHMRIIVAGGAGGGASHFIDRWGFGKSNTVTKKIKLPKNWDALVKEAEEWKTPIIVRM